MRRTPVWGAKEEEVRGDYNISQTILLGTWETHLQSLVSVNHWSKKWPRKAGYFDENARSDLSSY